MDEKNSHIKIRSFVIISIILLGVVIELVIRFYFPQYYSAYTIYIPIYFLILAIFLLIGVSRISSKQLHIGRAWARLLLLNAFQLLFSVGLLYYYINFIDDQRNTFLFVFGIYYLWFLALKTFILYQIDAQNKKTRSSEKQKKDGKN